MAKKCIDCGGEIKSRRKSVQRCKQCHIHNKKINASGRKINVFCCKCGKELTVKKTKTGMCHKCFTEFNKSVMINNRFRNGVEAWNKGISKYENEYARKKAELERRRNRFKNRTPQQRLIENSRTLIRNQFKLYFKRKQDVISKNGTRTEDLLGCTMVEFILHIESLFTDGMNWDNYGNSEGQWNIDHILPVSLCNFNDEDDVKKIFNYMNCRPMWAIDNLKKGNKNVS